MELILLAAVVLTGIGSLAEAIIERDIPYDIGKFFVAFSALFALWVFWV